MRILIPTMGALHAGHARLIAAAAELGHGEVVVSIFVNPLQFAPHEDFARYPRQPEADAAFARAAGADTVWQPTADALYPEGFATRIDPGALGSVLEGAVRPGHFAGVATVVFKLLQRSGANVLVLGEKDYQQLCVLRQMCRDLDLNVRVLGVPIVREADGLAYSSRNAYLSPTARAIAPLLHQTLCATAGRLRAGEPFERACKEASQQLQRAGFDAPDYLLPVSADCTRTGVFNGGRLLVAARLDGVRLIDNVLLDNVPV